MTDQFGIPIKQWQDILSLFIGKDEIKDVVLFGSRAKGNFRQGSDIDICLKGSIHPDKLPELLNEYDLLYLPWKLDLVIWDHVSSDELKGHINRVGIAVS